MPIGFFHVTFRKQRKMPQAITPFKTFLQQINLLYWLDPQWKNPGLSNEDLKKSKRGVWALAWYYCFQLSSYRLSGELGAYFKSLSINPEQFSSIEYYSQFWQIAGTIIGAFVFYFFLRKRRKNQYEKYDSIKRILNFSSIILFIGVLLSASYFYCSIWHPDHWLSTPPTYHFAKFLFGIGWASGIGCAIIWCCEFLPPFLRTSGAIFIGGIGFLGAFTVAITASFIETKHESYFCWILIFSVAVSALSFLLWRRLPDDSSFNISYESVENANPKSRPSIIVYSLLIGMSVQFFTFYVRSYSKIDSYDLKEDIINSDEVKNRSESYYIVKPLKIQSHQSLLQGMRYLGMFLGGFVLFSLSWKKPRRKFYFRKRVNLLVVALLFQLMFMIFLTIFWKNCFDIYHTIPGTLITSFCSGFFGCTWILCILLVAEQFSLKNRLLLVLLAPNAYRMADFILLIRTGDVLVYGGDKTLGMMYWGCIFIAIGIISALGMEDNFEGDPLYINNHERLSTSRIRDEIRRAQKEEASNEVRFLQKANKALYEHFKSVLKEQFYCSSIYQIKGQTLKNFDTYNNLNAFRIYRNSIFKPIKTEENEFVIDDPHPMSLFLIEQNLQQSFVEKVLSSPYRGGLLWYSGREYKLDQYNDEQYLIVDLSQEVNQNILAKLDVPKEFSIEKENVSNQWKEWASAFNKLAKEGSKTPKLDNLYAFFRFDAQRHIPGRYFTYIIKPYTENSELTQMIKTSVPLSTNRLEELRALITFVELELKNHILDVKNRELEQENEEQSNTISRLIREEEHNRKHDLVVLLTEVKELDALDVKDSPEIFDPKYQSVVQSIEYLYDMTSFNADLLRFEEGETETRLETHFKTIETSLLKIIENCWGKVVLSGNHLRIAGDMHRIKINEFLREMSPFGNFVDFRLKGIIEIPFKVILFELLKNAITRTSDSDPFVRIRSQLLAKGEGAKLFIDNSIPPGIGIDLNQFSLESPSHKGKAGIRTIKRYLSFFRTSLDQNWDMTAERTKTTFTLTLHIPEKCILRALDAK